MTVIRVPDTLEAVNAHFHREGMTDGLPILPPTREAVDEMLAYTDLAPQTLIAVLPPYQGQATVEKIAINAVMAGCLPPYFPVVLTAVAALAEEPYNLYGVLATTHPSRRTLVVISSWSTDRSRMSWISMVATMRSGRGGGPMPALAGPCAW